MTQTQTELDQQRFATPFATLAVDRVMTWFIRCGGIAVIIAVFTIFLFILSKCMPLFGSASVTPGPALPLPVGTGAEQVVAMGIDEWGALPFVATRAGTVVLLDATGKRPAVQMPLALPVGRQAGAGRYDALNHRLMLGLDDGTLALATIAYSNDATTGVAATIAAPTLLAVAPEMAGGAPIAAGKTLAVGYGESGERRLAAVLREQDGRRQVLAASFTQEDGAATATLDKRFDLSALITGTPERLLVDSRGESLLVATSEGRVAYFVLSGDGELVLRQAFTPFEDNADARIASLDFVLGDVSLTISNPSGLCRAFSLFLKDGSDTRLFGQTKEFTDLPSGIGAYAASTRNKAFLVGAGNTASLRYLTSAAVRWEALQPFLVDAVALSSKYSAFALLGSDQQVHVFALDDQHPESGWASLFGKIWYEGASQPAYSWQSSGGSDDNEPKMSLVPLLIGTFKGTFYAMLFALPLALLGAIYTAEFMHPRFKSLVKPTVEVMAAMPSVVLGFLAALWLAQLLEHRVPSLLMAGICVPATAMLFGWWWARLPMRWRSRIKPGYEFIAFMPLMLAVGWASWNLGPALESLVFTAYDPLSKHLVGDFPQWWREHTGWAFDPHNSLVVGVMMGFAVIPIIFTISEDALSNVPTNLRSASLALGASRWQTALFVVVPTASAGIFSAVMIGFGRAIGETMIMVMATGNTPVMNFNIFDGMRTLSATIATELPEAPKDGTLYRTLFLCAVLLFTLTFLINTIAEVLRQRLREKYKTV
ncbi:MAG: ABC transporter permease subunit [Planctomycetes bacterium]|nr:ABC transporter permease subunit [Planctomycetota bacterium]